ncbi:MAG: PfkB family carbohydrate kinase [Candidatus Eisenbacteria bacterium]
MSIVVVGSVALDTIYTPRGSAEDTLGGSAAYFALAARHFTDVHVVAVVGEDFPAKHRAMLEIDRVHLEGLETKPGKTFRWSGEYTDDLMGRKTLSTELNVFETFHPVLTPEQRKCSTVFLANIDPELQLEVLSQVENPRLTVFDTMNYWISSKRDALVELLRRVDVVLLNDEEVKLLAGDWSLPRAARKLHDMGAKRLVIKKSEHGAALFDREDRFFTPAYALDNPLDPTGAGDTFAGGFLGYLDATGGTHPMQFRRAMVVGTALASIAVEGFSPALLREARRETIARRVDEVLQTMYCPPEPLWPA